MTIYVLLLTLLSGALVTARGHKPSYVDDPNNFNCQEDEMDYNIPLSYVPPELPTRPRGMKSPVVLYNPTEERLPSKYLVKYGPFAKKYFNPFKKSEAKLYQVFQPAGEKVYDQASNTTPSSNQKPPAIQIYVV